MSDVIATNQTILVVGGGISGVTAAIEAAECGKQVILIEKNPSLGDRVSQFYKYFPQPGFPSCGMGINLRRMKAYGGSGKDAGLYGKTIKARQLEEIASK